MWEEDYKDCLTYINAYWNKIIFAPKRTRIFYRFIKLLDAIEKGEELYEQPKPDKPPYRLAVLH